MTLTEMELERQRRVEENRRRMEQLGLPQMAEGMAQAAAAEAPPKKKRERRADPGPPAEPTRRSSRNEGKERPVYVFESERGTGSGRAPRDGPLVKEGECEEVYGVEHVLALGCHQKEWEMFTDGYTSTGERIYDPENGASCHQCRQKTLGLRTSCSRCKSGLGMLCGDCLFARYGENVEEAAANKDWVCPCCRDLCNCSTHRKKRKWEATGALHRSVKARGYLSVAHYLVLNKAGGLEAKRAALATGFCPPDLEEKLRDDIQQLEEEAAAAPPPPPPQPVDTGMEEGQEGEQAAEDGKQQQGGKRRKRAAGGSSKGKGQAEGQGAEEGKGVAKPKAGAKGKARAAEAAGATEQAQQQKKQRKQQPKAGSQAKGAADGEGPAAVDDSAGGKKKAQRQRKKKDGQHEAAQAPADPDNQASAAPTPADPPAAAAGVLETSGASGSGSGALAAAAASPTHGEGEGEVSKAAPAVAPALAAVVLSAGVTTKAPFSFSRKRSPAGALPGSGAAVMEAAVAAPARRRRSGSL